MPVCSSCGIAWLDGEQHVCGSEPVGVALYVPSHWSTPRALVVLGLWTGLLWAIVPWATWGALQSVRSIPLVAVAGGATGVALTLLLGRVLRGRSRSSSVAIGLVTLPAGAFLFGALLSTLDGLLAWSGLARSLAPSVRLAPLGNGAGAVLALLIVWPLSLLLAGFAIWTTFQVRAVLAARGLAGYMRVK